MVTEGSRCPHNDDGSLQRFHQDVAVTLFCMLFRRLKEKDAQRGQREA